MTSDEKLNNVIPINQPLISAMKELLSALAETPWEGPEKFNAIFIDRKDFMKMGKVPNPPPPVWRFSIRPSLERFLISSRLADMAPVMEHSEFHFYRRIGDTIEYRER